MVGTRSRPRSAAASQRPCPATIILRSSIRMGLVTPNVFMLVAGHGRWEAAADLGLDLVPTIRLTGLTADQIRAYILADNQLALKAGWDESILAIELQHLLTADLDFEVTVTGFEIPEIDLILQDSAQRPDPTDEF